MVTVTPQNYLNTVERVLKDKGVTLYSPYQQDGVKWLIKRELFTKNCRGGFLCDEMGLGKTLQMISLMIANPVQNTLLILPANLIYQWLSEIERFIGDRLQIFLHHGKSRVTKDILESKKQKIIITTYSLMALYPYSVFHTTNLDRIILEECHLVRNHKSKSARSIFSIHSKYRWGITGTPIHNTIKDLTSLCLFLGIDQITVKKHTKTIVDRYILRRTKKDVERFNPKLKLPPISIINHNIDFDTEEEKQFYNKVKGNIDKELATLKKFKFNPIHYLELYLRMKQASTYSQLIIDGYNRKKWGIHYDDWHGSNTKLDYIVKGVTNNITTERPIIFTQFRKEMQYLYTHLNTNGIRTYKLDGSTTILERNQIIKNASIKDSHHTKYIDCIIVQIDAGGTGLNLQMFNSVWFSTLTWNPAIEMQAIARVHRIGQTLPVIVRKIVLNHTIDSKIIQVQTSKLHIISQILNDKNILPKIQNKFTQQDIIHILS